VKRGLWIAGLIYLVALYAAPVLAQTQSDSETIIDRGTRFPVRYVRKTYTFVDGPLSGQTVEYFAIVQETIVQETIVLANWSSSQNKTLAQCGIGKTALDPAPAQKVLIKPDENVLDNVWCDVDGTVDVDNGFRVGQNGEGVGAGITNASTIECCGEGSSAFKISILVEN